jgi:hypothetical protein
MTATKMKEYTYKPSGVKIDVLSTHDDLKKQKTRQNPLSNVVAAKLFDRKFPR